MLKLALRSLFRHRGRTVITLGAIVFGVAGLILGGGFVEDIFVQVREGTVHSEVGHFQIYAKGYGEHGHDSPFRYMIESPAPLAERIARLPHVRQVLMRLEFTGLLNNGRTDVPIVGEGVEADKEARLGSAVTVVAGRMLKDEDAYGAVVGEGVAQALDLRPGSDLTLLVSTSGGALNTVDLTVVGVIRTMSKDFDARAVRINLPAAQDLLLLDKVHKLVVELDDSAATAQVAPLLRRLLPADRYEIKPWYELAEFYRKVVELYRRQFGILLFIVMVMVLAGVANSVNLSLYERTGECGTLMALGYRGRRVFALLMLETTALALVGSVTGVAVGLLLSWLISLHGIPMPPPPNMNMTYIALIRPQPWVIAMAFAVGILATVLAGLLPARRIARIPVSEALRQNV